MSFSSQAGCADGRRPEESHNDDQKSTGEKPKHNNIAVIVVTTYD